MGGGRGREEAEAAVSKSLRALKETQAHFMCFKFFLFFFFFFKQSGP